MVARGINLENVVTIFAKYVFIQSMYEMIFKSAYNAGLRGDELQSAFVSYVIYYDIFFEEMV